MNAQVASHACRTLELAGGVRVRYVDCAPVLRELAGGADEVSSALRDGRDVLPGAYEGGLKTWECALDLVDWLARHPAVAEKLFAHKRVLEVLIRVITQHSTLVSHHFASNITV